MSETTMDAAARRKVAGEWLAELGGDEAALRRALRSLRGEEVGELLTSGEPALDAARMAALDARLKQRAALPITSAARVLTALRATHGLKSADVAREVGIGAAHYAVLERGEQEATLRTALALWRYWARALPGLRFEELFGGELSAADAPARAKQPTTRRRPAQKKPAKKATR